MKAILIFTGAILFASVGLTDDSECRLKKCVEGAFKGLKQHSGNPAWELVQDSASVYRVREKSSGKVVYSVSASGCYPKPNQDVKGYNFQAPSQKLVVSLVTWKDCKPFQVESL